MYAVLHLSLCRLQYALQVHVMLGGGSLKPRLPTLDFISQLGQTSSGVSLRMGWRQVGRVWAYRVQIETVLRLLKAQLDQISYPLHTLKHKLPTPGLLQWYCVLEHSWFNTLNGTMACLDLTLYSTLGSCFVTFISSPIATFHEFIVSPTFLLPMNLFSIFS